MDVEVVDKRTENTSKDVVKENVTPADVVEVTTSVDVVDKTTENSLPKDEIITDSSDTKAPDNQIQTMHLERVITHLVAQTTLPLHLLQSFFIFAYYAICVEE